MKDGETPFVWYIPYESQKPFAKAQVYKLLASEFRVFHPLVSLLIPLQLSKIKFVHAPTKFFHVMLHHKISVAFKAKWILEVCERVLDFEFEVFWRGNYMIKGSLSSMDDKGRGFKLRMTAISSEKSNFKLYCLSNKSLPMEGISNVVPIFDICTSRQRLWSCNFEFYLWTRLSYFLFVAEGSKLLFTVRDASLFIKSEKLV